MYYLVICLCNCIFNLIYGEQTAPLNSQAVFPYFSSVYFPLGFLHNTLQGTFSGNLLWCFHGGEEHPSENSPAKWAKRGLEWNPHARCVPSNAVQGSCGATFQTFKTRRLTRLIHCARSAICNVSFSYYKSPVNDCFHFRSKEMKDQRGWLARHLTTLRCDLQPSAFVPFPVAVTKHFDKSHSKQEGLF